MYDLVFKNGRIIDGTGNPWFKADLAVFDPDGIKNLATFAEPDRYPKGIEYVVVNGEIAVENGERTDALTGKMLIRGS